MTSTERRPRKNLRPLFGVLSLIVCEGDSSVVLEVSGWEVTVKARAAAVGG